MPAAGIQRQLKAPLEVLKVDYLHNYQAKFTLVSLSSVQHLGPALLWAWYLWAWNLNRAYISNHLRGAERGRKGGHINAWLCGVGERI